MRVIARLSISQ